MTFHTICRSKEVSGFLCLLYNLNSVSLATNGRNNLKTLRNERKITYVIRSQVKCLILTVNSFQTTLRLSWALQNIEPLREAVKKDDVMFGTLDTWLLHKLTGKQSTLLCSCYCALYRNTKESI